MNHKRGNTKNQRAGCLMCKPNKMVGWSENKLGHTGFGKIRNLAHSKADLADETAPTPITREELESLLGVSVGSIGKNQG